jgi:predicted Zn-dependent protease with MMP-like domain
VNTDPGPEDGPEGGSNADANVEPSVDPELERRRDAFEQMVAQVIPTIPEPFASQLATVAIVIEDEPGPGQQAPGTLLFGLYQGVPRTAWGVDNVPLPSRITLFRRSHEIAFPDPLERAERVRSTLLHELGHYLGMDEPRIRAVEQARRPR